MIGPRSGSRRGLGSAGPVLLALAAPFVSWVAVADAQTPTANDLVYAQVTRDDGSQKSLHLDLWLPSGSAQPSPLVIWIHPGAWVGGSYNGAPIGLTSLLTRGFAVASVEYRFSQESIAPAQIHDVKGAVRFLRAHAGDYGLDPNRFASWGSSSGGHLAAMLATTGDEPAAEGNVGGNLELSSRIQAAVDYFGPSDLLNMDLDVTTPPGSIIQHDAPNSPESQLIGFDGPGQGIGVLRANLSNPDPPFPQFAALVQLMSPVTHVSSDDAPMFIAHGTQDTLVPSMQSQRLSNLLTAAQVENYYLLVAGAGHGSLGSAVDNQAIDFLAAKLVPEPAGLVLGGIGAAWFVLNCCRRGNRSKGTRMRTDLHESN